jgi:mono/diheme cytochrome c family protein
VRQFFLVLFVWAASAALVSAQQSKVTIPVTSTPADDGKQMFLSYCASCHGPDGRGNGPTAVALKAVPSDLSQLSKNNKGVYPAEHVIATLKFGVQNAAHGSKAMPVWGPALKAVDSPSSGSQEKQALRINNLVKYVETLQVK